MYSRFSGNREPPPMQVPEHYSGWAFPRTQAPPSPFPATKPTSAHLDVAKPTNAPPLPPPSPPEPKPESHSEVLPPKQDETQKEQKKESPSPFASLFGSMGNAFPFSHGIGFEELLILGLLLLLSRNDGDTDTMLLIGLLLFCG